MSGLRFGVLGALEVRLDGRPVRVPSGRRRAVLARLLVDVGRPVPADALVEAAWADELPRDPHGALHTVVSRLRSQLGAEVVAAGPEGYRLGHPPGTVDAVEFEELVDRAKAAEPAAARTLLARALALWRGPAFGEHASAPFASAEAGRLDGLRLDAVELHASVSIACGDPGAAVAMLERLLADHPFREHAAELLVTALYHAGRQAEALDRLRGYRGMLAEELGLDPSPALVRLESRILGHELPALRQDRSGPPPWLDTSTALIGREDELAELVAAVTANRVTVVTGPGGVGKSRLAAEALGPLDARIGLPVTVTELAGVPAGRVAVALSDALGLRPDAGTVVEDVVEYLGAVPHLLVLDSCEHLIDEVRALVSQIVRRCRDVRVLATSRRRLGIGTEQVLPLAPLRLPGPGATVSSQQMAAAVRLFTDRVRRSRPGFALTADNTADVAELCRRFDGLPLALEIAASRAAVLGVADVLAGFPVDPVPEESGDLDAVVAWSYRLLTEDQRALLGCLSVFAGEFTTDAVRGLLVYVPSWRGDATASLAELVESSLVVPEGDGSTGRYRLLAIVRAFAAGCLAESGQAEEVRLAHASWVRDVVVGIAADWARVDGALLRARMAGCSAEVGVAVRRALDTERLPLAASITGALARCLHWTPGLQLGELMVEAAERGARAPGPEVAGGVAAGAFRTAERGELDRARRLATAALQMSDDRDAVSIAWLALGVAAMYAGDHDESVRWFRQLATIPAFSGEGHTSLALLTCYADDLASARAHADIALTAGPSGADASHAFARYAGGEVEARTDPARAVVLLTEAADEADRVGAEQVSRVARVALLALLVRTGRHGEAADLGRRLLDDLRRRGAWPQAWTTVRILSELLEETGRPADAAFFLGAAGAAASAPPLVGQDVDRYAAVEARLTERLGHQVLSQINALAASTPRAQVLSRAERVLATRTSAGAAGPAGRE